MEKTQIKSLISKIHPQLKVGGAYNVETILHSLADKSFDIQSDIADLNQNISGTYVEAEVQAISDKVDAILAALRTAGIIG